MELKRDSKQSDKTAIKSILTIDAYRNRYYLYRNDTFQPISKLTYNKQNFITSFVGGNHFISTTTEISRNIPEEDLEGVFELRAYEELGLDQAVEYVIFHYEIPSENEDRLFYLFAVEKERMDELFLPLKKEIKYFDLIVPQPLLYGTLYRREILEGHGVDCFLYITDNEASVSFYRNGHYLYSKSLDFSLERLYEKFCEIEGEQVDREEFFSTLETEGLKATNPKFQENFMKIFGEMFIAINDIIIYTKRAFQLESIDRMYVGSTLGPIIGLDEYSNSYLGLASFDLNFDYHIETDEWYTDQNQFLMLMTAMDYMEDESVVLNMTLYPRPPSFANRPSGQFIIALFLAISAGLVYPLYHFVGAYTNKAKIITLKPEQIRLQKEAAHYKKILKQKREEIAKLDKEIKKLQDTYDGKLKTLEAVYQKKVNYRLKSGIFFLLAEELHKFGVNVDEIETRNDTVYLHVVSSDDRKLTELIKYLTEKYYDQIDSIDIELIKKDPDSAFYRGLLKVAFK
jgi:hypothetical protein